jgi:hypothetical protein
MAQIIRLKRSTSSGTKPTTSDLQTGEIAINVYDGKAFVRKSGSADEVVEFVSTNTETAISGDVNLSGSVTASYFVGDGSRLENITVNQAATSKKSFTNQSTWVVNHNLDTVTPIAQVFDANDYQMIPQTLRVTNSNTITVTFESPESGYVVVAKGGHIVSGSISADNIDGLDVNVIDIMNSVAVVSGSIDGGGI